MADRQAQIPGGAYLNDVEEAALYQRQVPGAQLVNETQEAAGAAPPTIYESNIIILGMGQPNLVLTIGLRSSSEAPPEPPVVEDIPTVGPALTEAQRRRWFSTSSSVFESPHVRQARKLALEKLQRIELGILPAQAPEEEVLYNIEELEELVTKEPVTELRAFGAGVDTDAIVEKIVSGVLEGLKERIAIRRAEQEEEEAVVIFLKHTA